MLDFAECERLVSSARDKRSKPIQNNTRVEKRGEERYALKLHGTDIATFYRDGRIIVNSGGWFTVTTAQRLDSYIFDRSRARSSDRGIWYVQSEPDPADPEPPRPWQVEKVLKPFHALDPGPRPVKPDEGCVAGTVSAESYEEEALVSKRDIELGSWTEESIVRPFDRSSDYWAGYAIRRGLIVTYFSEHEYEYQDQGWRVRLEEQFGSLSINDRAKFAQCPHCKLFTQQHRAWDAAMNGGGWGRNRTHGYAKMTELLDQYGSREAWQEAYITNVRKRRAMSKTHKEWVERNRVLFEDGMEVTSTGYAKRPDLKAIARQQRARKRIEKKKASINKFVADAVNELVTNGLPLPSGGDCWGCAFRAEDRSIEPMGVDHLDQHIKERYYVPSMFVNALREAGYKDVGIGIHLGMHWPNDDPSNSEGAGMGGEGHRVSEDVVARDLRKYLYKRLIPEAFAAGKTAVTV